MTQFSLATNEYPGGKERTEYHDVVTWVWNSKVRVLAAPPDQDPRREPPVIAGERARKWSSLRSVHTAADRGRCRDPRPDPEGEPHEQGVPHDPRVSVTSERR